MMFDFDIPEYTCVYSEAGKHIVFPTDLFDKNLNLIDDIKNRTFIFLNSITSKILQESLSFQDHLNGSVVTFKFFTCQKFFGSDLILCNGVRIKVIIDTSSCMKNRMVLIRDNENIVIED